MKHWMAFLMGGYVGLLMWLARHSSDWPLWAYWALVLVGGFLLGVLRGIDHLVATRRDSGGDSREHV